MSMNLVLARATIGDLLLNEKISYSTSSKNYSDISLAIPEYQRSYKWNARNSIQLADDIIEAFQANREVYRVGTLILHQNNGVLDIVDGQQRVITFSLLLESMMQDIDPQESSNIAFLDQLLSPNPTNLFNVQNNYRTLKKRIGALPKEQVFNLRDYITEHCEFIVLITKDLSEAFQLFDSQNARGKQLYPHDLLKAYHLREMSELTENEIEAVVRQWENMDQHQLAHLFGDYLYRVKCWANGSRAYTLSENNISMFKGITEKDNYPYARFFKGALAYAEMINSSATPFVLGQRKLRAFQLTSPIIAGKPFFDYASCYFELLRDIQNNDRHIGVHIRDNQIIRMLNDQKSGEGVGDRIARLLFDTALLLYIDKFCPEDQSQQDSSMLNQIIELIFLWAYSLRAQYYRLGWESAQDYILEKGSKRNRLNIYRAIIQAYSPTELLNALRERLRPLPASMVNHQKTLKALSDTNPETSHERLIFKQILIEEGK